MLWSGKCEILKSNNGWGWERGIAGVAIMKTIIGALRVVNYFKRNLCCAFWKKLRRVLHLNTIVLEIGYWNSLVTRGDLSSSEPIYSTNRVRSGEALCKSAESAGSPQKGAFCQDVGKESCWSFSCRSKLQAWGKSHQKDAPQTWRAVILLCLPRVHECYHLVPICDSE